MLAFILPIANFFTWFATTRVGQIIGLVAAVLGAVVYIYYRGKRLGRAEEQEKIRKETDKLIKEKDKIDADVRDDSDASLDDRMQPWIRK